MLFRDDIVILGTRVAKEYLSIIRYLGVPINMMKSISSEKGLLEFAKRVVSAHHGDLSPISGRHLLRTVRSPNLVADLLVHVIDLGFLPFPNQVREILQRLKPQLSKSLMRDELLVIARAYVLRRYQGVSRLPSASWQDEWFLSLLGLSVPVTSLLTSLQVLLRINSIGAFEADCRRALIQFDHFTRNWWRIPLFEGTLGGILSIPLIVMSPAFWSYFLTYLSSLSRLDEIGKPIYWDMLAGCIGISWKGMFGSVLLELDFNYGESELDSTLSNPVAIPEMVVKQVRRPSLSEMLVLVADLRSFVRVRVGSPPRKLRLRTHIEALPAPKAD
nr:MAG: RNA-dependent RNA polymerase [Mitovirus sp.]